MEGTARTTWSGLTTAQRDELIHLADNAPWQPITDPIVGNIGAAVYEIAYTDTQHPLYGAAAAVGAVIYVGKATAATRCAGVRNTGASIEARRRDHAASIDAACDLDVNAAVIRFVEVPHDLAEAAEVIVRDQRLPVWNQTLAGFGNRHVGNKRGEQQMSRWDWLHRGRPNTGTADRTETPEQLAALVRHHITTQALEVAVRDPEARDRLRAVKRPRGVRRIEAVEQLCLI